ncbi:MULTISPECIES: hypothetical protein [Moorena]|uniref:Uncharacterized protein n=1 Tax=Moorena producens 3L TaxID=489825 RepID=F4XPK4_9CYAN|nr:MULTISPECIES: hypothetical protein [Moorena]NES81571.1 hypothetical protein [Moorena sp. SIO2B7]EGJ33458.1 hypothetical protein LYNGBM3L_34300 [Moorena producens 3L]NEP30559.1 hypothetical protein [Moorena sp. SIO3B2]NEP65238.1 hypothetical protein [Moorena sp. SIO3A5]NEQ11078.1 hypothetical protein [Moorena sp. SIO4E2]
MISSQPLPFRAGDTRSELQLFIGNPYKFLESIFAADGGSTNQVNGILVARANKKRIWSIPALVAQVYFNLP